MLRRLLKQEIKEGQIDVETTAQTILIRIREKGSFASGSALLNTSFVGVIDKIASALTQIEGKIAVEGHTDNVPINSTFDGRARNRRVEIVVKQPLDYESNQLSQTL